MKKLLLISTALIAVSAVPAHAGPVSWALLANGASLWSVAANAASALLATSFGRIAVSAAASLLSAALTSKTASGVEAGSSQVELGDDASLSFTLGLSSTGGVRKYVANEGSRIIAEVVELSCLPQIGTPTLWVNDEEARIDWDNPAISVGGNWSWFKKGGVNSSTDYSADQIIGYPVKNFREGSGASARDRMLVKYVDGTQLAADPQLVYLCSDDPDYPWTADMVGTGKSYAICYYYFDPQTMTSPPTNTFVPPPLRLYDLRNDGTNGGYGPERWDDPTTWTGTGDHNPAIQAYNIIRGIYWHGVNGADPFGEWIWGGKNLAAWRLPPDAWIAAANSCDETVTLSDGATEPRYRTGAKITVDMVPAAVLEQIGQGANMRFAEVGGVVKPMVDVPVTSAASITDESILITEGQTLTPFPAMTNTYNALTATYPEPAEKWATKDAAEYVSATATAADGGRYLPTSMTYSCVPYADQVQRLMRAQLEDYRRFGVHVFVLPPNAVALEPLDALSWSSARNGYVDKMFLGGSITITPALNVQVNLTEADPSDYDWSSDFELPYVITTPVNPTVPVQGIDTFAAVPVTVQDAGGTDRRAAIRFSVADDETTGLTALHVQLAVDGGSVSIDQALPINDDLVWTYDAAILPATTYQARGRLLSDLTPASDWSEWVTLTTPAVYLSGSDLSPEVNAALDAANAAADGIAQAQQDAADAATAAAAVRDEFDALTSDFDGTLTEVFDGVQQEIDANKQTASDNLAQAITDLTGAITQSAADVTSAYKEADADALATANATYAAKSALDDAFALSQTNLSAAIGIGTDSIMRDIYLGSYVSRWGADGTVTSADNEIYPLGKTWTLTAPDEASRPGLQFTAGAFTSVGGAGHVIELDVTLLSGSLSGTKLLWDNNTSPQISNRRVEHFVSDDPNYEDAIGQMQRLRYVVTRPDGATRENSVSHYLYLICNWGTDDTDTPVSFKVHRVNVRPATDEELATGLVADAISAAIADQDAVVVEREGALAQRISDMDAAYKSADSNVLASVAETYLTQSDAEAANAALTQALTAAYKAADTATLQSAESPLSVSDFREQGLHWTNSLSGAPANKGGLDPAVTFRLSNLYGYVAQIDGSITVNKHLAPRGYLRNSEIRKYRTTVVARHAGDAVSNSETALIFVVRVYDENYAYASANILNTNMTTPAGGAWTEVAFEWSSTGASAYILPFVYCAASRAESGVIYEVAIIKTEDITAAEDVRADTEATLTNLYWLKADGVEAVAQASQDLTTAYEAGDQAISTNLSENYYNKSAADTATASKIATYDATIRGADGQIKSTLLTNYVTTSEQDSAIAAAKEEFNASISGLSGSLEEIKGLDLDALAGTAFGQFLTGLDVQADGSSATVTQQAQALATLGGKVAASWSVTGTAGSGGVFSISGVAQDGGDGASRSVLKFTSDVLQFDGEISQFFGLVTADQIDVTDLRVGAANIELASITGAHIAELTVDTLNLAKGSVSYSESYEITCPNGCANDRYYLQAEFTLEIPVDSLVFLSADNYGMINLDNAKEYAWRITVPEESFDRYIYGGKTETFAQTGFYWTYDGDPLVFMAPFSAGTKTIRVWATNFRSSTVNYLNFSIVYLKR
ncbi:hypothetical protein RPE78_09165 [Thioclava litoralis]|uniref:DUF1983 domain-containing protein n=1 Tax=Thioclava litoralis TaxID=3076557 RepID=A0ABZ1DXA2_9RHOB|nr:hypothetical protein RPE78_09165 [Thioclava sp. FTW29]